MTGIDVVPLIARDDGDCFEEVAKGFEAVACVACLVNFGELFPAGREFGVHSFSLRTILFDCFVVAASTVLGSYP